VTALALAQQGMLASGGCDRAVRVWNGLTGIKLKEFKTDAPTNSLAFSADGTLLCSTTWDRWYLWDWARDQLILERKQTFAIGVKFSPARKVLAIGRELGMVMVIDDACGGPTTKALLWLTAINLQHRP
jgi:WD40 repeat protein